MEGKKTLVIKEMGELDRRAELWLLTNPEIQKWKISTEELWNISRRHESLLYKKSRVRWLKEEDENSKFFHKIRIANDLKRVFINGLWVEELNHIKEEVKRFIELKYKEQDDVPFETIVQRDNDMLVAQFSVEKVKQAVWECDGNKCLGPDA
ncbi:hypothetical protein GmHk_17G048275 [Glycine max]|nr:hypothetical protein GmHk_17G048275 [Glycine max]